MATKDKAYTSPRFVLYDGRAKCGDPDDAAVLDTARTEAEARRAGLITWAGYDAVWFEGSVIRTDLPPMGSL